jgi:segregation and condensation protein A
MSYVVRLEQFEGPLDLLLHLIQREDIDIYDIPIARITDQYLAHIENMERLDLQVAGDFVVMAATLLRIKARLLLPVERPDEQPEEDPRHELVARLLEYKKYKEAALRLEAHERESLQRFTRPLDPELLEEARRLGDEETFEVNMPQLIRALQGVLARIDEIVTHEIEREPVSLDEKCQLLRVRLVPTGRCAFSELFSADRSRLDVIVTFMAILELIKRGELRAHQSDSASELWIFRREDREQRGEERASV